MTTEKKTRSMSPKGFLHKSTGKAALAAASFIETHRAWLETGELALFTTPILLQVDSKALMPTPALEQIKEVVLAHHLAEETRLAQEKMNSASESGEGKTSKAYLAIIWNSKGEIQQAEDSNGKMKDLRQSFDKSTQAESWVDNRLFNGSPDWFGTIEATKLFKQDGSVFTATVLRVDAIGRVLKAPKGPVLKAQKKSGGRLSFGVKCKESKASFSRG